MKFLGIDLGFYQVKYTTDEHSKKYPSVVGYPSAIELKNAGDTDLKPEQNISIRLNDNDVYYLGEKAMRDTKNSQLTFTADKTDNITDKLKYLGAIGLVSRKNVREEFRVVTGLPVDEYAGMDGLKDKLQQNMEGEFEFTFNNHKVNAVVPSVVVIPQSAGAYYDHILDRSGSVIEENVNPKTVVIDIGYRTTDVVTMKNAKYSPTESFTDVTGVSDVHTEVRKHLLRKFRINKDITEIDEIVRNEYVVLGGKKINVSEIIQQSVKPYAEKIISTIPMYFKNMSEIYQVLVTGGGANLMYKAIEHEFNNEDRPDFQRIPVQQMSGSEFSNAAGYYKYARFLQKNS